MADILANFEPREMGLSIHGERVENNGKHYKFEAKVLISSASCGFFSVANSGNQASAITAQVKFVIPNGISPTVRILYTDESEEERSTDEVITNPTLQDLNRWGSNTGVRPSGDVASNLTSHIDEAESGYNSNYYNPNGYKVYTYDLMNALVPVIGGTTNTVKRLSTDTDDPIFTDDTTAYFFNQRDGVSRFIKKVNWRQTSTSNVVVYRGSINNQAIPTNYLVCDYGQVSGETYDLFVYLSTNGQVDPIPEKTNTDVTVWLDSSNPSNIKITWDNDGEVLPESIKIKYTGFTLGVSSSSKEVTYNFTDGFAQYTWGAIELLLNDKTSRLDLDITVGDDTGHVNITDHGQEFVPVNDTTVGTLTYRCRRGDGGNDDGYSNKVDSSDAEDTNTTIQTVSLLTQTYKLSDLQIKALGNFLWSSTLLDNLQLVNNNPIENVVSVKALPVDATGTQSTVTLGNVNTQVNGLKCSANFIKQEIGSVSVPRIYNNFVDFEHSKIELYLPLIGTITDLSPSEVIGYTITLKYCFDLITGDTLAMVYNNRGGGQNCIGIYKGSSGIDIPLTASNRAQVEAGYISDFVSAVGSVATGNVGGAINAGLGAMTRQYTSKSSGSVSGVTSQGLPNKAYLVIIENVTQIPSHYAHTFGRPCCLGKKLSSLIGKGFTQCNGNVDLSGLSCSDSEREEIRGLLASGIYL